MPAGAGWALAGVVVQRGTSSLRVCNPPAPSETGHQGHLPRALLLKLLCRLQLPADPSQNCASWLQGCQESCSGRGICGWGERPRGLDGMRGWVAPSLSHATPRVKVPLCLVCYADVPGQALGLRAVSDAAGAVTRSCSWCCWS